MYPINDQSFGIGIGRYPEDIYDGVGTSRGNPWSHPFMMIHELIVYRFLCTSAAAEIVYLTALDALKNQSLLTDPLSQSFYQRFLPSISPGEYSFNTTEFNTVLRGMITFGDSFLSTVQQHAFQNGSISEEFDRSCPLNLISLLRYIDVVGQVHGVLCWGQGFDVVVCRLSNCFGFATEAGECG